MGERNIDPQLSLCSCVPLTRNSSAWASLRRISAFVREAFPGADISTNKRGEYGPAIEPGGFLWPGRGTSDGRWVPFYNSTEIVLSRLTQKEQKRIIQYL